MKRIVSILLIVMMLGAVLAFAGCTASESNVVVTPTEAPTEADTLSGTYKLVEMIENGESLDMSALTSAGTTVTLNIDGDKATMVTATNGTETQTDELTVDRDKKEVVDKEGNGVKYSQAEDGKVTLEKDNRKMVFEKQ